MPKLQQIHQMDNLHRLFFKAFSNYTRLEIIQLLRKKPLTVTEICEKTGFEQSRVSHNLRCLEHCGFVKVTQNGNFREYSLDEETIIPIVDLFDKHIRKYKERLENCGVIKDG
ncbi:winged helix-turn-helix transcriptional regulator [Candidatus Pacearchaeota archaeon]|nr:winged helix-turn-helix transcriptional regulator [Candidatus Pacearchaeota archaeon]